MGRVHLLKAASGAAARLLRPQSTTSVETSAWCLAGLSQEGCGLASSIPTAALETLARGLLSCAIAPPQAQVVDVNASSEQTPDLSLRAANSPHHAPNPSSFHAFSPVPAIQSASASWQTSLSVPLRAYRERNTLSFLHAPRLYATDSRPPSISSENSEELEKGEEESEDGGSWEDGMGAYETILAEVLDGGQIGLLTINRPDVLNALNTQVMYELTDALQEFDADPEVKAIILTGSGDKAFAAGADIKEMRDQNFVSAYLGRLLSGYEAAMSACRKPIIAAVNGYALGGGCELAMMCDVILAGKNAVFGQPETNLGVIPGMGGTQRLIRAVGKSRAMEMILSGGSFIKAEEAVARGLASRVVHGDSEQLLDEAVALAQMIARKSVPVVAMAKEAVNSANDLPLSEGVKKESRLFSACFGLRDQKEGMTAFLEKRKPQFEDK